MHKSLFRKAARMHKLLTIALLVVVMAATMALAPSALAAQAAGQPGEDTYNLRGPKSSEGMQLLGADIAYWEQRGPRQWQSTFVPLFDPGPYWEQRGPRAPDAAPSITRVTTPAHQSAYTQGLKEHIPLGTVIA